MPCSTQRPKYQGLCFWSSPWEADGGPLDLSRATPWWGTICWWHRAHFGLDHYGLPWPSGSWMIDATWNIQESINFWP